MSRRGRHQRWTVPVGAHRHYRWTRTTAIQQVYLYCCYYYSYVDDDNCRHDVNDRRHHQRQRHQHRQWCDHSAIDHHNNDDDVDSGVSDARNDDVQSQCSSSFLRQSKQYRRTRRDHEEIRQLVATAMGKTSRGD